MCSVSLFLSACPLVLSSCLIGLSSFLPVLRISLPAYLYFSVYPEAKRVVSMVSKMNTKEIKFRVALAQFSTKPSSKKI